MDGLTVVVTGVGGGLGEAVARRFVAEGARVVVCGREADELDELVADIEAENADENRSVVGVRADVRDEYDVERLLELAARESDDGIDVVAACAAVAHGDPPLTEESYAAFDDTLRTNARGVFATIREAVPHLAEDARVLVPASLSVREEGAGLGSYAVSKAAAAALAQGFAADLDATVGVVDPGDVGVVDSDPDTSESNAGTSTGSRAKTSAGTSAKSDHDLGDVADLFVWAATEASADAVDGEVVGLEVVESATV